MHLSMCSLHGYKRSNKCPKNNTQNRLMFKRWRCKRLGAYYNLTENMKEYEAGDFGKAEAILAKGIQLSYKVLPELVQLANQLKTYNALQPKQNLQLDAEKLKIRNIYVDTLSSAHLTNFIKERIPIQKGDIINFSKIEEAIDAVYATRFVQKATYELEKADVSQ